MHSCLQNKDIQPKIRRTLPPKEENNVFVYTDIKEQCLKEAENRKSS
jgi:hypothetical protein